MGDLEAARNNGGSSLTLYFTKESHIHTLVNLLLLSGLPIANRRIPELDYAVGLPFFCDAVHLIYSRGCLIGTYNASSCPRVLVFNLTRNLRFELYERHHGRGKSDKEYSIKLSLSEGAHSSNVLDSTLDARHALNVQPRRSVK